MFLEISLCTIRVHMVAEISSIQRNTLNGVKQTSVSCEERVGGGASSQLK